MDAEAPDAGRGDDEAEPRESIGCTIGIALGLFVVIGCLLSLGSISALVFGSGIEGEDELRDVFVDETPPFGLELSDAARYPSGELFLWLERPDGASGGDAAGDSGSTASADPARGPEPVDPEEIVLVQHKSREAARAIFLTGAEEENSFGGRRGGGDGGFGDSARLASWEKDPSFAWHTTVDAEEIAWSRYRADFRIERSFREGGEWRDSGRIDLCQKDRNLILFAQWPVGVAVSRDDSIRVVRTVRMLSIEN